MVKWVHLVDPYNFCWFESWNPMTSAYLLIDMKNNHKKKNPSQKLANESQSKLKIMNFKMQFSFLNFVDSCNLSTKILFHF